MTGAALPGNSQVGLEILLVHSRILLPVQVPPVAELLLKGVGRYIIVHLHHLGEVKLDHLCYQNCGSRHRKWREER